MGDVELSVVVCASYDGRREKWSLVVSSLSVRLWTHDAEFPLACVSVLRVNGSGGAWCYCRCQHETEWMMFNFRRCLSCLCEVPWVTLNFQLLCVSVTTVGGRGRAWCCFFCQYDFGRLMLNFPLSCVSVTRVEGNGAARWCCLSQYWIGRKMLKISWSYVSVRCRTSLLDLSVVVPLSYESEREKCCLVLLCLSRQKWSGDVDTESVLFVSNKVDG